MDISMIDTWVKHQRLRGFSEAIIYRRVGTLRMWSAWITPLGLFDATGQDVEDFISVRTSPRTRHAYRSDLRVFYRWAMRRGLGNVDPTADTDPIRIPRAIPRPAPIADIIGAINSAPSYEVRAALTLAAFAGLRRVEISRLTGADCWLDADPPALIVSGKGSKDRVVPAHPAVVDVLRGCGRGPVVGMSPEAIGRACNNHLRSCALPCTLHHLRHSFATELARVCNGNLLIVGRALGHERIDTTAGYVALAGTELSPLVSQMFPAAA